jgi:hypothetical protein
MQTFQSGRKAPNLSSSEPIKGGFTFRRGRKISGGLQVAPLGELQQGLGVWVKAFHTK